MTAVVLQPSYIPWRGFFHQIAKADVFIHYDDVQYDKDGWRNRNLVKTRTGPQWLTIPVLTKGNVTLARTINEIEMNHAAGWSRKHWETIKQLYSKAPYFKQYADGLKAHFEQPPRLLADFVIPLCEYLAAELGITKTKFVRSSHLACLHTDPTERLINILKRCFMKQDIHAVYQRHDIRFETSIGTISV